MSSSSDLLFDHRADGRGAVALGQLLLERGQLAVADLRDALEVALPLGAFRLHLQLVDALRDLLDALERALLLRPPCGERVACFFRLCALALERFTHILRLVRHRGELDLELAHAALGLVELER